MIATLSVYLYLTSYMIASFSLYLYLISHMIATFITFCLNPICAASLARQNISATQISENFCTNLPAVHRPYYSDEIAQSRLNF